jgi:hypothetical protein
MYHGITPQLYIAKIHIKIEIHTFEYGFLNYLYYISINGNTITKDIIR